MAVYGDEIWDKAIQSVLSVFNLNSLYEEQIDALKKFFSIRDIFVNLPTSYGKSLIFQSVPIVADVLLRRSKGTSVVVVILPLKSLMDDQVHYLNNINIPAISLTTEHNDKVITDIVDGKYTHVYGSPECFLSTTWRGLFGSKKFRSSLVYVAVDEAHCISQWGIPGGNMCDLPFRKWYGNLGELRSLIPDGVKLIVATASASKATKTIIYSCLKLNSDTLMVAKSPDRANLKYYIQCIDRDIPLRTIFSEVIENVKSKQVAAERTVIYCQTRKQCGILYRVFETSLQQSFYKDCLPNCKNRLVEMYHAGTPNSVKKHISKNMSEEKGHIRVLIATIAFGMGIDCKQVKRIIHFGPSKNIECYIQESGRAGQDGTRSDCIILFNALLSCHCAQDMKELLHTETGCRRVLMMKSFGYSVDSQVTGKHSCCDKCAEQCNCGEKSCKVKPGIQIPEKTIGSNDSCQQTRQVNHEQKDFLKVKLKSFREELIQEHMGKEHNAVVLPTSLLEFGRLQVLGILQNCHRIFSISDIMKYVEVWRHSHAIRILQAINEVFDDIDGMPELSELSDSFDADIIGDMDWEEIYEDSSLFSLIDSNDESMLIDDTLESDEISLNNSSFYQNLLIN